MDSSNIVFEKAIVSAIKDFKEDIHSCIIGICCKGENSENVIIYGNGNVNEMLFNYLAFIDKLSLEIDLDTKDFLKRTQENLRKIKLGKIEKNVKSIYDVKKKFKSKEIIFIVKKIFKRIKDDKREVKASLIGLCGAESTFEIYSGELHKILYLYLCIGNILANKFEVSLDDFVNILADKYGLSTNV